MSAAPAAKRARAPALDAVVSTVTVPGLGCPNGLFVLANGNRLACAGNALQLLAPSGQRAVIAGHRSDSGQQDGPGAYSLQRRAREEHACSATLLMVANVRLLL